MTPHNSLYATSIRATREGKIYPIPERCCRGVRVKERGTPRRVHKGGTHGHVQAVVVSSTSSRASNRRVGMLPMRNVSRQGEAPQDKVANSCISNIRHTAPVDERPPLAERKCGILYRANCINLYVLYIKYTPPPLCFLQRPLCCLWYDGDAYASSDRALGKVETGWTLSRWWIK